nr:MAG TPA: hypothetical protein [Caudoviricetes sp.]
MSYQNRSVSGLAHHIFRPFEGDFCYIKPSL